MKKFVLDLVLVTILPTTVFSTSPVPPGANIRCVVGVPYEIELNIPFEVTFTFEALEELHVDLDKPHKAWILVPWNAVYISGDTLWTGILKQGQPQSLTATYKLIRPENCKFGGRIETLGDTKPDFSSPPAPFNEAFAKHVNGAKSRFIQFPEHEKREPQIALLATDSGLIPVQTDLPPIKNVVGPRVVKVVKKVARYLKRHLRLIYTRYIRRTNIGQLRRLRIRSYSITTLEK